MSYNVIYGKGSTPKEALLYAKINEIGHGTNPSFLKKTNIKYLEYSNTLQTDLFMASLDFRTREPTISEEKAIKKLKDTYGEQEFNTILNIYKDTKSKYCLCFKIDYDSSNDLYLYKFLY